MKIIMNIKMHLLLTHGAHVNAGWRRWLVLLLKTSLASTG
jgi:hypothetical protein